MNMKRMLLLVLLMAAIAMPLIARAMAQSGTNSKGTSAASAPLKTLKGTVKPEGEKMTFVSDKDKKSWEVMNPEALKGHEGHHVQVKAHVYADKNAIHVMEVKMLPTSSEGPSAGNNPETRY
jgi:hypothetical protein